MKKALLLAVSLFGNQLYAQCWQTISAGSSHTATIASNGTIWAWGSNYYGEIGDGTNSDKNVPTASGSTSGWQSIVAGGMVTFAIKTDGTLWAAGMNTAGQLGDGTMTNRNTLTQIGTDTNWKTVSTHKSTDLTHTLAIKNNGALWAWGENTEGQLGDGTNINRTIPTIIGSESNWQSVSAGYKSTAAIKINGTLWTWGANNYGVLGDGSTGSNRNTPAQVGNDTDWRMVSVGNSFMLAIKNNGTLWAAGYNVVGQLGDGTYNNRNTIIQIGTDTNWIAVSAGGSHSLALKGDGTLWAWGNKIHGQLGMGAPAEHSNIITPTQVGTDTNWKIVSAGSRHSLAQKIDGSLWSWGANEYGQQGNGALTAVPTTVPTPISCNFLSATEKEIKPDISIYPNPTKDKINLSSIGVISDVALFNLLGQQVLFQKVNSTENQIDMTALSSGTYLVKVYADNQVKTLKVVKE